MANSAAWLKDKKVLFIALLAIVSIGWASYNGLNFGIEFTGGTRIPILLEQSVTNEVMDEMLNQIKIRTTKFGLTQVVVKGIGDRQINVELSQGDPAFVREIQTILNSEGKFEAIIDGKVALTGENIVSESIRTEAQGSSTDPNSASADQGWGISFVITTNGVSQFGDAALGKGDFPVYLFLDKAENSVIFIRENELYNDTVDIEDLNDAIEEILSYVNSTLVLIEDIQTNGTIDLTLIEKSNKTKFIVQETETELIQILKSKNYSVSTVESDKISPAMTTVISVDPFIDEWGAIGLISSPQLSPDIASGGIGQSFRITGRSAGDTFQERVDYSNAQVRLLKSTLSGGALPVSIELGSAITIPPSLGKEFLNFSVIGAVIAFGAVFFLIILRFRNPYHLLPLAFVAVTQMSILISILGSIGTLDLATIAGLFGAMGISVDAQIVATDELFGKPLSGRNEAKRRVKKAMYIITRGTGLLTLVMFPLMFSGLVEIIGFITATMLGSILGMVITTQVYNAIANSQFNEE